MPDSDAALREVVIRLQATVETLDKTVERIVAKTVSLDAHLGLERRVEDIESTITWGFRLVIGIVIAGLLGLLIVQGGR